MQRAALIITLFLTTFQTTGCSSFFKWAHDPTLSHAPPAGSRTFSAKLTDEAIEGQLYSQLTKQAPHLVKFNLKATSYNGVLLITGTVNSEKDKQIIESIVKKLPYIRMVHNEIEVSNRLPNTQPTDQWITARLNAKMVFTEHFPASQIKVTTHNRTVYLLGSVNKHFANQAVSMAKQTNGVAKIVKIIEAIPGDPNQENTENVAQKKAL